jgi:hypothetical protein
MNRQRADSEELRALEDEILNEARSGDDDDDDDDDDPGGGVVAAGQGDDDDGGDSSSFDEDSPIRENRRRRSNGRASSGSRKKAGGSSKSVGDQQGRADSPKTNGSSTGGGGDGDDGSGSSSLGRGGYKGPAVRAQQQRARSGSGSGVDVDDTSDWDADEGEIVKSIEADNQPRQQAPLQRGATTSSNGSSNGSSSNNANASQEDLMMMEDLDDMDLDFDGGAAAVGPTAKTVPSEPVDEATCIALREILFGRATGPGFPDGWLQQGFFFNPPDERANQTFGLVQKKGGPCGPIAAVQAHVLQHLLPNTRPPNSRLKTTASNWGAVSPTVAGDVLVEALTTILVRVFFC